MAKRSALTLGIIMIIIGIWGFIQNPILGVFDSGSVFNVVNLILGIVLGAIALWATDKSVVALKTIGIIYVVIAIIGFIQGDSVLGIMSVNAGDNWLNLIAGIIIGALGFADKGSVAPSVAPQM